MTSADQRSKHLIDGRSQSVVLSSFNHRLVQGPNFGLTSGLYVLKHAASVFSRLLENISEALFKHMLIGNINPLHHRNRRCLPIDHHAGGKQIGFKQFAVLQATQCSQRVDRYIEQDLVPNQCGWVGFHNRVQLSIVE